MRVSATAKYLRASTRKTRLVTQAIKGKRVEDAEVLGGGGNAHVSPYFNAVDRSVCLPCPR